MIEESKTNINIRNYQTKDRDAVRQISLDTSILTNYHNIIFDDEIIADLLTAYFTDYEPEICCVAEEEGHVVGYALGTANVLEMRRIIKNRILPILLKKTIYRSHLLQKNNRLLIKNIVYSYFKGEFGVPDFAREYPATLHVNIHAQYQGRHLGSLLVKNVMKLLKKKNVHGIHFGVLSEAAKRFFLKMDFKILFSGEYTFLSYLTKESLPLYIMGKKW